MPTPGTKRTPAKLVALRGSQGKAGKAKNSPKPRELTEQPKPPSFLNKREQKEFTRYAELLFRTGVLTEADVDAVAALSRYWVQWLDAGKVLNKEGLTFTSYNRNGESMVRRRPEVEIGNGAWQKIIGLLQDFGMTPASRSRVTVKPKGGKGDEGWGNL